MSIAEPPIISPPKKSFFKQAVGDMLHQLRSNLPELVILYSPAVVLMLAVWWIGTRGRGQILIGDLVRDPAQVANLPFYTGLTSNIGVLLWAAAAGICLLTWSVAKARREADWARFFGFAGTLTAVLVTDDVLLFHEQIFPDYLFPKGGVFHMSEAVVYVAYAALAFTFLWKCRHVFARCDWGLFVLAAALLGLSIASDKLGLRHLVKSRQMRYLIEDSLKLLGIFGWSHFFARTSFQFLAGKQCEKRVEEKF